MFTDTHCHIHEAAAAKNSDDPTHKLWAKLQDTDPDAIIARAADNNVMRMVCVGCTLADSKRAVAFVQDRPNCWASVGIHPHEAKDGQVALDGIAALLSGSRTSRCGTRQPFQPNAPSQKLGSLLRETKMLERLPGAATAGFVHHKIVAIGEIGLDYFYNHSTRAEQQKALRFQIELALAYNLPIIFHVREAFADFWPIFDSYQNIRGVLHSFTDSYVTFEKAMARDLYIGMNGIITFTKDAEHLRVAKELPLQKLLLETDAPFLTPQPLRGTVNEPAHVRLVAEFLAGLRNQPLEDLATQTTQNARHFFSLD